MNIDNLNGIRIVSSGLLSFKDNVQKKNQLFFPVLGLNYNLPYQELLGDKQRIF